MMETMPHNNTVTMSKTMINFDKIHHDHMFIFRFELLEATMRNSLKSASCEFSFMVSKKIIFYNVIEYSIIFYGCQRGNIAKKKGLVRHFFML